MRTRSSISRRLMWLNVLVCGAALIITGFALLIYDQSSYRRLLVENVSAQADVVGQSSLSALIFADPESARTTLGSLAGAPNILAASLFAADKGLFASFSRSPELRLSHFSELAGGAPGVRFEKSQLLLVRELRSGDRTVGYLAILADASGIHKRLNRYLMIVGAVLVLSLGAAILLSTAFRRAVAQPIVELANAARQVSAERDYSLRVTPSAAGGELSVLVNAFNDMLAGIHTRDVALETERARLQAILDTAPVGIVVVHPASGVIILANKTANQILRETVTSGKDFLSWTLLRPDRKLVEPWERPLARALHSETTGPEEFILVRRDRSETWVRSTAAPVRGGRGEIAAGLLVMVGIDDQKKAQEALLQSEKLAAAGRLAASISHEINNPLESVTNLLFIALSQPDISPELRNMLTQADQELARVSHIATQTLRFYRQSTNPTSVDVGKIIDSVLQLLEAKIRNAEVRVSTKYLTRERIVCFEGEMRQVFTNLISNALDAVPGEKGVLALRTKLLGSGPGGSSGIQITIADNGNGIPPELAGRIFEPFYTTKGSRGTGLGLWVTKEIVAKHKGTIRVRSKVGCGTVFVVFLPFANAEERAQDARTA